MHIDYQQLIKPCNALMEDKFIVICLNTCAPNGVLAFCLLEDEDGNAMVFDSDDEAYQYVKMHGENSPFAYSILNTSDIDYV